MSATKQLWICNHADDKRCVSCAHGRPHANVDDCGKRGECISKAIKVRCVKVKEGDDA